MRITVLLIFYSIIFQSLIYSQSPVSSIPTQKGSFSPRFEEIITNEPDITVSSITVITQSSDGYIWIGTRLGVARYNGFSFFSLTKKFNTPILERDINAIVEDKNKTIWIATGRGLVTYRNNAICTTESEKQFNNIEIHSLALDKNGNIWVGARNGLFKITGNTVTKINDITSTSIWSLLVDSKNRLWVAVGIYGVVKIENGKIEKYVFSTSQKETRVYSIFEDHKGDIWFGGDNGIISQFKHGKLEPVPQPRDFKNRAIQSIAEDEDHNLWIATIGNGLLRYKDGKFQRYTSKQGLSADAIKTVFVDRENDLWIGTAGAGLNKLKDSYISTYTIRDGLPNNAIWSIFRDNKERVWIGTSGSGLCYLEKNKITNVYAADIIKNKAIRSFCNDHEGTVWCGTNGSGLYKYSGGKLIPFSDPISFPETTIKSIYNDSKDNIWIGTNGLCYILKKGKFTLFKPKNDFPRNTRFILEDRLGNIWFGCGAHGLYKWDNKKIRFFGKKEGLISNDVLSMHCDKDNVIWITTDLGLSRLKDNKITNFVMNGIFKNLMIFCCIEDDLGQLWLSTNIGILKAKKQELNNFAEGKANEFSIQFFGKEDGLLSTECNGGSQSCGIKMDDGKIWFPTMNGIAIIDPFRIRHVKSSPPNVVIESLIVNDSSLNLNDRISFPSTNGRFEFHFSCLSYKITTKNRFKYKLEGLDADWIDAGNRTTAYYTNLPHGDYQFRVIAANSDEVWNSEGASIFLHIEPIFYETWWFFTGVTLLLFGLVYSIYLYRLRSLQANKKRLSELVEEKTTQLNCELKERLQKEKELKESEERYKYFIEASNEAFYDWDIENDDVIFSYRWAEILETEYSSLGSIVESWENVLHPDDKIQVLENLDKHFKGLSPFFEMEYRIITKKANIRWIFDRGKVVAYDDKGKALRLAGTMHDITEKKRMEDEFLKMKKIESIGVLAGGIAHDFNNILTSILGNISLAKYKLSQNDLVKVPDLLTNSEKASFRAKDLTYQLLTFSKGGQPIIKTTDINHLVKETLDFAIHGTNVISETHIQEDLWFVDVDEGQITQVIQNIVINACQAMPNGGKVTISAENYCHETSKKKDISLNPGDYVKISIKDEGSGIPKELLEKIFDPYFTTKENGQGLGLATTYSIIKKHDGSIIVESEIDKGTTFIFFLPRSKNENVLQADPKFFKNGEGRILVMDDDKMIRELFREMLSETGYEVETAKDGHEAFLKYKESFDLNKFDCLIMDLTIPGGMGGKETLDLLKNFDPNVKAIVSSGYSNDPILAQYEKYGFIGVITKPFHIEDISEILSRINP